MSYKFQINLRGIIDLLSNHLYSGPHVFLRELLQNGVDAIRARGYLEPGHAGEIQIEVIDGGKTPPTLLFIDNGVGLTEEELHQFLATIGQSSKRDELWERRTDFIGQFGIGLLSCFVVSDEIVVITRSVKPGAKTVEWRGKHDGTYAVRPLERDIAPGTQVYLTCRSGSEEYFAPERVAELAMHFGNLLPFPIRMTVGNHTRCLNETPAPWQEKHASPAEERQAFLDFGREAFGVDFFDAVPLRAQAGGVAGIAYVLPHPLGHDARRTHRVYLKGMLLSESAEGLLPDWAFFVKCVVNAQELRPTASREAFYEDDKLAATRDALGDCLRGYLVRLADADPRRLQRLIAIHYMAIKALAVQDDDFFRIIVDLLPFETSMGTMTLGEYRRQNDVVRYVPSHDQFRQMARVAAAHGQCIIDAGFSYDSELLEKLPDVFADSQVEAVDPSMLVQTFEDLEVDEQERVFALIQAADVALQPFKCSAEAKKFLPTELPALYSTDAEAEFFRSVEQAQEKSNDLFSGVLGNFLGGSGAGPYAQLCFNYHNPLIRKIAGVKNRDLLRRVVQMLYVQALLLGHHPLQAREMKILNEGLIDLIDWSVEAQGDR